MMLEAGGATPLEDEPLVLASLRLESLSLGSPLLGASFTVDGPAKDVAKLVQLLVDVDGRTRSGRRVATALQLGL